MVPLQQNLVDLVWFSQPVQTFNNIIQLSTEITGRTIGEKVSDVRTAMADKGADVLIVTALDEVACKISI